ncbi:MAG: nucleoside phosphorylase, partial [Thermoprotei archaeon]
MAHREPVHILAKPGEISPFVLVAGDPNRIKTLSKLLKNPVLVNKNRGLLVYTGYWRDVKVTLATHGIGGPSSSIVFEELKMLGAEVIIRLGTTGSLTPFLKVGDLLVVQGATYTKGHLEMYVPDGCMAAVPDFEVTNLLLEKAEEKKIPVKLGLVFSSDAFYVEDESFARKWSSRGILSVEMECATLFVLGHLRKFKTGALLVVSNSLVDSHPPELGEEQLQRKVIDAAEIIFECFSALKNEK